MSANVLLVHGFTGSTAGWSRARAALAERGVSTGTLDLAGHGDRAGERDPRLFTLDAALDDIGAAVREAGSDPVLLGYSMGGRLALHFAERHPERIRAMVLESASPGLASEEERSARRASDEALARSLEREGIESFVARWEALPLFASQARLPAAVRDEVRARRLCNDAASLAAALRGLGTGALPSLWARLRHIGVPTLLLAGEEDVKFVGVARRMAERLRDVRVEVVARAGHRTHLERPERWADLVASFAESPRPAG